MVASTPKKSFFEVNNVSNTQALFFEFAFDSPTNLSTPSNNSRYKRIFYTSSRLVLGILITGLVLGSGILNNELFMGKSDTKASLAWIPSWFQNFSTKSNETTVVSIKNFEGVQHSERAFNPETIGIGIETMNPFKEEEPNIISEPSSNFSASAPILDKKTEKTPILVGEMVEEQLKEETAPKETELKASNLASRVIIKKTVTEKLIAKNIDLKKEFRPIIKPPVRPIIKPPVNKRGFKLSNPVIQEKQLVAEANKDTEAETSNNKLRITSEAYHSSLEESSIDGKKIFIKFGAKWCLPCKMMEANVFPDEQIQKLLFENYHTLNIDVDNLDGINLRQFFKVEGLPSFIILDSQQNEIGRYQGVKKIEELRSILGENHS
jgi:Thiol:disulfide interchange protein